MIKGLVGICLVGALSVMCLPAGAGSLDLTVGAVKRDCLDRGHSSGVTTTTELTATLGIAGEQHRPPTINTQAWIWSFPEGMSAEYLDTTVEKGILTWKAGEVMEATRVPEGISVAVFSGMKGLPGGPSSKASSKTLPHEIHFIGEVHKFQVSIEPTMDLWSENDGETVRRQIMLPKVNVPEKGRRLIDLTEYDIPGFEDRMVYLEVRPVLEWQGEEKGNRIRRESYTGSWVDRLDVGGEVSVEAYSYH